MAAKPIPLQIDTVVVGNGPSALILSYILHGNIPYYNPSTPHPDPILHSKLSRSPCLLDIDAEDLTAHFAASRLSYSTQALPINVLLDTLLRPLADTDPGKYQNCVEWRLEESRRVSHAVLGNTAQAGGQWADNPVSASWDIRTLSYAEMLSLPSYTFEDHHVKIRGQKVPDFHRPTRREVAGYLAAYPEAVGIRDSIYTSENVSGIRRVDQGFHIGSHNIFCKHVVLASGVFSSLIPPRPLLQPLKDLPHPNSTSDSPLLVVGSGFTAADVILSTPPSRRIIHIFKWDPENHPSPLRACHPRAYPEYASVYRRMKLSVRDDFGPQGVKYPMRSKKPNPFFAERDWERVYEGLPNTCIKDVVMRHASAILTLETVDRRIIHREISNIEYLIGRRGSLGYLDGTLAKEVLDSDSPYLTCDAVIFGHTLRDKVERTLELAPNLFALGSMSGDSLIRFAYGGCVFSAREIMRPANAALSTSSTTSLIVSGFESDEMLPVPSSQKDIQRSVSHGLPSANGHTDLHIDKKMRSLSVDLEVPKCGLWREPGWWAGGFPVT
ncbi:hypothetical protein MMC28_008720 [Mycoblastus sanguinarius]|nr:hypothetical protein [Mycoblastus sanguinarius]